MGICVWVIVMTEIVKSRDWGEKMGERAVEEELLRL